MSKGTYLVLGGCGSIGRNVVCELLKDELTESVIVVDKTRPELSWLTGCHKEIYTNEKLTVKQKNLGNPTVIKEVLNHSKVDYVINCAAESRHGMSTEVYDENITKLGVMVAKAVAECPNVKRLVQLTTACMYTSNKEPTTESGKINPWTKPAKAFAALEKELAQIENLNYIILRPAFVYGIGDRSSITPRIVVTAVYQLLGENMKLMWTKNLMMNTVHLVDVARAAIHVCKHGESGQTFNLVDKSQTSQGSLTSLICQLFDVKYSFAGKVESTLAKVDLKGVCESINEKHMSPWSEVCAKDNISHTPLSPYIDKELLNNNHLSVDGTAIESINFTYSYPQLTKELLEEVLNDLMNNNLFPKSCIKA